MTEVALGVALLVTAGLLLRTFVNLWNLDPGFDPRDLVTASVSLQDARYADGDVDQSALRGFAAAAARERRASSRRRVSLELPYDRLLNRFRFVSPRPIPRVRRR